MLTKEIECSIEYGEANQELCPNGQCSIVKTASERPDIFNGIRIKKNHAYLYVIAMGAGDYFGENKNGDFFWEKDLIQYYKKFLNAGIFVQHDNKDPNKSIGKVLKAEYNNKMHRVELVLEIKKELAPTIYDAISQGQRIAVSMGVKVPTESCSYCGQITKGSIANRCEHLKYHMHEIMPNGVKVFAINHPPLNFFDISVVRKPADHQGYALFQKVASYNEEGYVEDTQNLSISEKVAGLRKIAELTKRFGAVAAYNPLSFERITKLRSIPKDLLRNFLIEKEIVLHPAEYLGVFASDLDKEAYDILSSGLAKDRELSVDLLRDFHEKAFSQPKTHIKVASYKDEMLNYLEHRDLLMKTAVINRGDDIDSFGNKEIQQRTSKRYPFGFHKFALIRAKLSNGDVVAYTPKKFLDLMDAALRDGVVKEITGVFPNGVEAKLYSND